MGGKQGDHFNRVKPLMKWMGTRGSGLGVGASAAVRRSPRQLKRQLIERDAIECALCLGSRWCVDFHLYVQHVPAVLKLAPMATS